MKTRTKFVILAIISLYACFIANIILALLGKEQLSDAFCVAWDSAFLGELALLAGLTLKKPKEDE